MTKYKTSLRNQKITLKDALLPEYHSTIEREKKLDAFEITGFMIIIALAICLILMIAKGCDREPMPAVIKSACVCCHNKTGQMVAYFKRNGSKSPEEMANAVLRTKSPRLLSAIAVVVSGGNHSVRKSGYKKRHDGAFQVNKKYWGKVPYDAAGQALQAEAILTELTATMPIKKALSLYGGDSTDRYQKRVLAELVRVPR